MDIDISTIPVPIRFFYSEWVFETVHSYRTSPQNIQSASFYVYVISRHFCLKWWDGWLPQ